MFKLVFIILIILLLCIVNLLHTTKDKFQTTNNDEYECDFSTLTEEEYNELSNRQKRNYDFHERKNAAIDIISGSVSSMTGDLEDANAEKSYLCNPESEEIDPIACRRISTELRSCIGETELENCEYSEGDLRCKYSDIMSNELKAKRIGNNGNPVRDDNNQIIYNNYNPIDKNFLGVP